MLTHKDDMVTKIDKTVKLANSIHVHLTVNVDDGSQVVSDVISGIKHGVETMREYADVQGTMSYEISSVETL